MKMKSLLCFLAAVMIFSAGAQAQSKEKVTPIEYNDKLASITDSLYEMGTKWGTLFQEISSSDKNYSRLAPTREAMNKFTARKITEVQKEKAVGTGGEGLKSAMISFLTFEKNMINKAFMPLEKLSASSTQEEVDAAIKELTDEADKEGEVLKLVAAAQEAFAKQNGFEMEKATEED